MLTQHHDDWRSSVMDAHLTKEKSSAYRNLVKSEDAMPIYDCLYRQNCSDIVSVAKKVLIRTGRMPLIVKREKSEECSDKFRLEGNRSFVLGHYQTALVQYNKALCHAPPDSRSLKVAYANRSSVLHKLEAYGEAIADIDLVMRMGCPQDIEGKLAERHRACRAQGWIKKLSDDAIPNIHSLGKFFELSSTNPQINTATLEVGVTVSDCGKKVVAARDISPGSLVAMDSAYVSQTNDSHKYLACSFCHKLAFNLIPCKNCCDTLFCGSVCSELAMKEYHDVECHMSEVLCNTSTECRMAFKAIVRMKSLAMTWEGMITQTGALGTQRVLESEVKDIFSESNPFTILCVEKEKPFVHGTMYNLAIDCAVVMFYLDKMSTFFPREEWRRKVAVSSLGRTMMHLCVHHAHTQMQVVVGHKGVVPYAHAAHNYGWFPLISKLRNACSPNLIALGANKEMALVAVQPIKLGEELTIPYLGHWLDSRMGPRARQRTMFSLTGVMCRCRLCVRGPPKAPCTLTDKQPTSERIMLNGYHSRHLVEEVDVGDVTVARSLRELILKKSIVHARNLGRRARPNDKANWRRLNIESMAEPITSEKVDAFFEKICKALAIFADVPFSKEYAAIYKVFRRCLEFYQAMRYPQHLPRDIPE